MNKLLKTGAVYLGITIFTMLLSYIYSLYSHGMASASMTYLFLIPFLLGSCVYVLINILCKDITERQLYRPLSNIYNTAVAILTVGQLLRGIFEIAGSGSKLLEFYYLSACILFAVSFIIFCRIILNKKTYKNDKQ
jgi:dipeptide/tripeptide permease